MKKISILIPCYNEEKSLPLLYPELVKLMDGNAGYEWELMYVNDGSADGTLQELKRLRAMDQRVNYVDLSRNFGKENAMLAGFDHVTGDFSLQCSGYRVKDGKRAENVTLITISGNFLDMLNNVLALENSLDWKADTIACPGIAFKELAIGGE